MSTDSSTPRSAPVGTLLLLAVAGALYVTTLAHVSFSAGGGDASMGEALAAFFFTVALWVALAILTAVGAIMGEMPRWAAMSSFLLVPLAGVTTFVAIDMCSRHIKWAVVVPVLLPLLVAFYALWARWPTLRAKLPAKEFSIAIWGAIVVLSAVALWFAM